MKVHPESFAIIAALGGQLLAMEAASAGLEFGLETHQLQGSFADEVVPVKDLETTSEQADGNFTIALEDGVGVCLVCDFTCEDMSYSTFLSKFFDFQRAIEGSATCFAILESFTGYLGSSSSSFQNSPQVFF